MRQTDPSIMFRLWNPGYKFGEICVYKLIVSHLRRPMLRKDHTKFTQLITKIQGWGGPAVQYRQSIPVLGNLGPVLDWRSNFGDPGIIRTCNEDLYWLASTRKFWNCNGLDWWPFEDLPHPCLYARKGTHMVKGDVLRSVK